MEPGWERLTLRQRQILEYIETFVAENGYPPSVREIGEAVGLHSPSAVVHHLERLEQAGYLIRTPGRSRSLRLRESREPDSETWSLRPRDRLQDAGESEVISIPLVGVIAAGEPIPVFSDTVQSDVADTIELTRGILGDPRDLYALRVQGDSMIDALIHDGDIVILRATPQVENGEMAAVWLRDREETTLKRVYWEGNRVRLQPANPAKEPIYIDDPRQVEIRGKVVMVIRRVG
ncbi:MAG: transcriptional repressor LexA [Anaerolineae bacterium]|nr:transcriptional repressor LexA [Anaerolineae bacterium]MCX8066701.1 transcriptional repressor LexA [Anaerolineae bacterium]MDW7993001.1 transcriptional repressor LexA [Anaerolineae bacterium]